WLELIHDPITCNRVAINVFTYSNYDEWLVDVFYDGAWHNVLQSRDVPSFTWYEIPLGGTFTVTAMRVKHHGMRSGYLRPSRLYEAAFYHVSPVMANFYGTVVDAETGYALEGVRVTVGDATTLTDASGAYMLSLVPGTYTIAFEKFGYASVADSIILVGGSNELNIQMSSPSHFSYSNLSCWEWSAGFKVLKFRCTITNTGPSQETHTVTIYKYRRDQGEATAQIEDAATYTLGPGESVDYAYPGIHSGVSGYTW
ncbi:unnamed protein product, partial [marine sediment metagenome]